MIIGIVLYLESLGGSCHLLAFCTSVAIELRLEPSVLRSETISYILF